MSPELALDLVYYTIFVAAKMSSPILISAIVVGVLINIVQTVTSIRDMSLTFVPKLIVAALVLGLSLPWSIEVIVGYFQHIFKMFSEVTA